METGKVEYAPDYRSDKKQLPTIAEMSGSINLGGRVIFEGDEQIVISVEEAKTRDHQKLKDAVVEAAKAYHSKRGYGSPERALKMAVAALLAFEAEHGIGESNG